jgi:hypothetical protein
MTDTSCAECGSLDLGVSDGKWECNGCGAIGTVTVSVVVKYDVEKSGSKNPLKAFKDLADGQFFKMGWKPWYYFRKENDKCALSYDWYKGKPPMCGYLVNVDPDQLCTPTNAPKKKRKKRKTTVKGPRKAKPSMIGAGDGTRWDEI